jgi:preprotein translocase subunit SecD
MNESGMRLFPTKFIYILPIVVIVAVGVWKVTKVSDVHQGTPSAANPKKHDVVLQLHFVDNTRDTGIPLGTRRPDGSYEALPSIRTELPEDKRVAVIAKDHGGDEETILVSRDPELVLYDSEFKEVTIVQTDEGLGLKCVLETLGAERIYAFTKANIGRKIAFVMDGRVQFVATIRYPIVNILGVRGIKWSQAEAERMASILLGGIAAQRTLHEAKEEK